MPIIPPFEGESREQFVPRATTGANVVSEETTRQDIRRKKFGEEGYTTPEGEVISPGAVPESVAKAAGNKEGPQPGQTFKDPKTGETTGFVNPAGMVFLGNPSDIAEIKARQERKAGFQGVGGTGAGGEVGSLAQQSASREAAGPLEAAGAFEDVTPTEPNLEPYYQRPGEGAPVIGPSLGAFAEVPSRPQGLLGIARSKGWIKEPVTGKEAFGELPDETIREAALREIRQKSFDKGISLRETFGTVVEGIPLVGSLVSKYARGLIETPSANAQTVTSEINRIKEAASTGQEKVRNNLEDPEYGLTRAREMEEDLAQLQGRLKLLINTSPILRANADEVNLLQEQVLEAQEKVSRYRNAATFGLTAQLTGTGRVVPTDEQIYFELKELNKK